MGCATLSYKDFNRHVGLTGKNNKLGFVTIRLF